MWIWLIAVLIVLIILKYKNSGKTFVPADMLPVAKKMVSNGARFTSIRKAIPTANITDFYHLYGQ
jgi:hypothetical protein